MYLKHNLVMTRGDTYKFDVALSELSAGTTVTSMHFTVRRSDTDPEILVQKTIGSGITLVEGTTYRVRLAPEDTADLAAGGYAYDLQVGLGADIYTLLKGTVKIAQDVTY